MAHQILFAQVASCRYRQQQVGLERSCRHGGRRGGKRGGRKEEHMLEKCWHQFFFVFFFPLPCLLAISPQPLQWTWLHMAWLGPWLVTWQGCRRESRRRRRNVRGCNEYLEFLCMGPKWQFEELWPYRLQDMQKAHWGRRGEMSKPQIKLTI